MAFSSTISSKIAEYLVTSDKVTLSAFFRCGIDRANNALVVQVTDEFRMTYDEVAINRGHIRILLTCLINRVHVNNTHMQPQFVDNIAPGIVLTPSVKTLSQGGLMQCLRITMRAHHAVLVQPPMHFVDIPIIHAMGLMGHLLCKGDFIDHVIPLPVEKPNLQFFGIRASGEYIPWDYYLNAGSAALNEGAITIMPPQSPVVIQDDSSECPCCKDVSNPVCHCCNDDTPISIMDTDSPRSPSPESPSPASPGASTQGGPATSTPGSPRPNSPDTPRASPLSDHDASSPAASSVVSPVASPVASSVASSVASPVASPVASTAASPGASTATSPVASTVASTAASPILISDTPRLDALLVSRTEREQQSPHYLDEYVRPRPSTPMAVRYMVYRAYRQKIEDFGCSPFNQDHVSMAKKYLILNQDIILQCINNTLDEAEYRLNRLTKGGLTDLIGETGPGSPSGLALGFLNDPDIRYKEIEGPELELIALFNHSLRSQL